LKDATCYTPAFDNARDLTSQDLCKFGSSITIVNMKQSVTTHQYIIPDICHVFFRCNAKNWRFFTDLAQKIGASYRFNEKNWRFSV